MAVELNSHLDAKVRSSLAYFTYLSVIIMSIVYSMGLDFGQGFTDVLFWLFLPNTEVLLPLEQSALSGAGALLVRFLLRNSSIIRLQGIQCLYTKAVSLLIICHCDPFCLHTT